MDHAQETGIWRAIGEVERAVAAIETELEELREESISKPRALLWTGAAFFAGIVLMGVLSGGDRGALRPTIIEAQERTAIDIRLACPTTLGLVCRQIADAAKRVAIAILREERDATSRNASDAGACCRGK